MTIKEKKLISKLAQDLLPIRGETKHNRAVLLLANTFVIPESKKIVKKFIEENYE